LRTNPQPEVSARPGTVEHAKQQQKLYDYWKSVPWDAIYGQYGDRVEQITVEKAVGSDGIERAAISMVVVPNGGAGATSEPDAVARATESCKDHASLKLRHCFQFPSYPTLSVTLRYYGSIGDPSSRTGRHRLSYVAPVSGCPAVDAVVLYTSGTKTIPRGAYTTTSVGVGVSAVWASSWMTTTLDATLSRECI
jgi:hypothetical protein